ncbi:MAG: 50S ribosomal protein L3 N(5)-glutamine methyltransferase [Granulosicoccaceae bacterium]
MIDESKNEGVRFVLSTDKKLQLGDAIRLAAQAFEAAQLYYGHGTDNAIDEASWLLLHALGLSPLSEPDYDMLLNNEQVHSCNEILTKRIDQRLPAAYLTGEAWFAGLRFKSDDRALVPRSPLAEFIMNDFFNMLGGNEAPRILDLCTGGGCIAIACAYAREDAIVTGSDISEDALALAAENVQLHNVQSQVQLLHSGLFDQLNDKFDLIVSNPPYVDENDINAMAEEFHHEPQLGLLAGEDGLDLVRDMLLQAPDYLSDNGLLVVEVGNSAAALEAALPHLPFLWLEFSHGGSGVFVLTRQELLTPH